MKEVVPRKGGAFPHCAAAEPQGTILTRPLPGLLTDFLCNARRR